MIPEIIALIVLVLLSLVGLVVILIGFPGTFFIVAGAILYNLIVWEWEISLVMLIILASVSVFLEIVEPFIGAIASKKYGTSKYGMVGAVIGTIAGAIVGVPVFLVGSILGALLGAVIGAVIFELFSGRKLGEAFKAGIGALFGRAISIFLKCVVGIVMIIVLLIELF